MSKVRNTNQKKKNERAQENTHCAISVMNLQPALTAVDGHLLNLRVLRNGSNIKNSPESEQLRKLKVKGALKLPLPMTVILKSLIGVFG